MDYTYDHFALETSIHMLQKILRYSRPWYHREYYKYPVHPAIADAIRLARPDNWHQLVLEHPHQSIGDQTMIAFTRDDKSGDADRQVKTSIGKYLRRHFSLLQDHQIRDITALHVVTGVKIVSTMAEMLHHLMRGPHSCMRSDNFNTHPYEVYDPALGWSMAVREHNGDTVARALVYTDAEGNRAFVRSYNKPTDGGYSHSDTQLEAWMNNQGIAKQDGWDGAKIKVIKIGGCIVGPYIDGADRDCKYSADEKTFTICDGEGEYRMENTNGFAEERNEYDNTCEDCGDGFDDGDGYWVGYEEDTYICRSCCHNDYQYVYGRRGNQYYIRDRYSVEVNGEYYDEDYLSDNEIVSDVDGEYCHLNDVIYIESEFEYYPDDDERICYAEDTEQHELRDNCWMCTHTDKWYTDGTECVEINGEKFHPDSAPEITEANESTTEGESE